MLFSIIIFELIHYSVNRLFFYRVILLETMFLVYRYQKLCFQLSLLLGHHLQLLLLLETSFLIMTTVKNIIYSYHCCQKHLKSKSNTYKQHQVNYKMIQNSAFNNKITKKHVAKKQKNTTYNSKKISLTIHTSLSGCLGCGMVVQ